MAEHNSNGDHIKPPFTPVRRGIVIVCFVLLLVSVWWVLVSAGFQFTSLFYSISLVVIFSTVLVILYVPLRSVKEKYYSCKNWLLELDDDVEIEAYENILKLLSATKISISSSIKQFESASAKLLETTGGKYTNSISSVREELEKTTFKLQSKFNELQPLAEQWAGYRWNDSRKLQISEEFIEAINFNISEENTAIIAENLTSLNELSDTFISGINEIFQDDDEKSIASNALKKFEQDLGTQKESIENISQIVGSDALAHAYAIDAQKIKPRLMATLAALLAAGYLTANAILFGIWQPDSLEDALGKIAITFPIAYLLFAVSKRWWEGLRHRELYTHKRNTTITYYSFLSYTQSDVDSELKSRLTSALIDALSINPAEMMKRRDQYRADASSREKQPMHLNLPSTD